MNFPAGLEEGFEIYLHEGHLRVMNNGSKSDYKDLPEGKRAIFRSEMKESLKVLAALNAMGYTEPDIMEFTYVGCRYGALNSRPDLVEGKTQADAPSCDKLGRCCGFGIVCRIPSNLSRHEYWVAKFIGKGLLDKEICSRMQITIHTCRTYMNRIHAKLNLNNRNEVALWAQNLGL